MRPADSTDDGRADVSVEAPREPSTAAEYRESLRKSPEMRRRRVAMQLLGVVFLLDFIALSVLFLLLLDKLEAEGPSLELWIAVIATSVVALILFLVLLTLRTTAAQAFGDRLDRERTEKLRAKRDAEIPPAEAQLTRLVSTNRALLDEYQKPVRAQARTSYTFAQIAILVGLLVLVTGVVITLLVNDPSAQLGVAGLTAVGAALSGYIARTYLRVYERAQYQLNFYFREPLITSYLLTAERLAEKLEGTQREQAYAEMVREIVRAFGSDLSSPNATSPDQSAAPN